MSDYIVVQSEFIKDNIDHIYDDLDVAHRLHQNMFTNESSTWTFDRYNIFNLTAPSTVFYKIFKEVRDIVRGQLGDDRPLWFQAWVNHHRPNEVLDWHAHEFDYHGYISLDPKKTITEFDGYEIENKPGNIYFGPGYRKHRVKVLEDYDGYRTTIGYDIHCVPEGEMYRRYEEKPFGNMGLVPLL